MLVSRAALVCALAFLLGLQLASAQPEPSLYGTGTESVELDVSHMLNIMMSQARPAIAMGFRATTASAAVAEYIALTSTSSPSVDGSHFLVSDMPVPAANYAAGMLQIPFGFAKGTIMHSVPASNYTGMVNISACLLAKMMAGTVTTWDHPDVLAINPNLSVAPGARITFIGSTDPSPAVFAMTSYMQSGCAPAASPWTLGAVMAIPAGSWPAGTLVSTSFDFPRSVLNPAEALYRPYSLTLTDFATGDRWNVETGAGIPDAALQLGNGTFLGPAKASNAAIGAVLTTTPQRNFPSITANWDVAPLKYSMLNGSIATGWPITMPFFILAPRNVSTWGAVGSLLRAFLTFALSPAGQAVMIENDHVSLPDDVLSALSAELATQLIVSPDTPAWNFEPNATGTMLGAGEYVFSAYRDSYLTQQADLVSRIEEQLLALRQRVTVLESLSLLAAADRAAAAVDRGRISAAIVDITATETKVATANNIAIAGVVLAVLLAVVALTVAAVYIVRTKKLDQKYSKYLPLGVKARFDQPGETSHLVKGTFDQTAGNM